MALNLKSSSNVMATGCVRNEITIINNFRKFDNFILPPCDTTVENLMK